MRLTTVLVSAAALFFPLAATLNEQADAMKGGVDTLGEAELIESLGWGKKESQALTHFLRSVDQLGDLVHQQQVDPATTALLDEFQGHARDLMAHAVYEYLQLANNPRVLSRLSSEEGLVMNFLDTLTRLLAKVRAPTAGPLKDALAVFDKEGKGGGQ
ncbi:hypothetical protein [Absidia glauca]|uniref:Uncharacterized protein n=1 Tax=Absidia glauca TaxID=4829 RepID=A0A168N0E7_ABSGL|nr:hypothetical protein [Absidia glauca]